MSFRIHLLSAALSAGMALLAGSAHAGPVLTGIGAATTAAADGIGATPTQSSDATLATSTVYTESNMISASYAQASAWSNQHGWYGVGALANGMAESTATASLSYRLTNDTGSAQSYSMKFHIFGGGISTSVNPFETLLAGEYLLASYGAAFSVDGAVVWSSGTTLRADGAGVSVNMTGTRLNDAGNDGSNGSYFWDEGFYEVDLGVLAAGASLDIGAEVTQRADSHYATSDPSSGDLCGFISEWGGCGFKGQTQGSYGDPFGFDSGIGQGISLLSFTATQAAGGNDVPEPATLALAGLGLLGAGAASRRRRGL